MCSYCQGFVYPLDNPYLYGIFLRGSGPLREQQILLTTQPSLQHKKINFLTVAFLEEIFGKPLKLLYSTAEIKPLPVSRNTYHPLNAQLWEAPEAAITRSTQPK